MGCRHCSATDAYMLARGPSDLAALLDVVRAAVAAGTVVCVPNTSSSAIAEQPGFAELDVSQPWPDVLQYSFECPVCSRRFELSIETYHGSGAVWRRR